MARKRWLLIGAVVVTVVATVAGVVVAHRSPPEGPSAASDVVARRGVRTTPSAWDELSKMRGPDGVLTLDGARQAFAVTFEPLPGAPLDPAFATAARPLTRSVAMRAVLQHWQELTPDQRQVVGLYLADPDDPGLSQPAPGGVRPNTVDPVPFDPDQRGPTASDPGGDVVRAPDGSGTGAGSGTTGTTSGPPRANGSGSTSAGPAPGGSTPAGTTPRSGARFAPPTDGPPQFGTAGVANRLETELRVIAQGEAARLGWVFPDLRAIRLHLARHEESSTKSGYAVGGWTVPRTPGSVIGPDDTPVDGEAPVTGCEVYLPPSAWSTVAKDGTGPVSALLYMSLAHEAFHCMQAFGLGRSQAGMFLSQPDWVIEGSAEWAGYSYLSFGNDGWFEEWLTSPTKPLTQRDYDATGLYYLLEQVGRPLWPAWVGIWGSITIGNTDTDQWLTAISGPAADHLRDAWGASYYRQRAWGDDWDYTSKAAPGVMELVDEISSDTSVDVPAFSSLQRDLGQGSGQVLIATSTAPMRTRDANGKEKTNVASVRYCIEGDCRCPDGSGGEQDLDKAALPLHVAVDTPTAAGTLRVRYTDLHHGCEKDPPPPSKPGGGGGGGGGGTGGPDPGPGGGCGDDCAGSSGDPHLSTVDQFRYDFMAVGEFTALQAGDGFELQTRQELMKGRRDLSVNTAAAVRIGEDRVVVSVQDAGARLTINGRAAPIEEPVDLGGGAHVQPDAGGVDIVWPDGSTVYVLPLRSSLYGLHVLARLSDDRRGQARGLLGPAGKGRLQARDGTTITYARPHNGDDAYRDLYRTFGDSWRVDERSSLFDYDAGQSVRTFDQRDLPDAAQNAGELSADARAAGEAACGALRDDAVRDNCIYDVGITGDETIAESYGVVQGVIRPAGTLKVGDAVTARRLEPGQADLYRIVVDPARPFYLRHTPAPDEKGLVTWRLTDPAGAKSGDTTIDEDLARRDPSRPGIWTLTVIAPKDGSITYGFSVVAVTPDQTFDLPIGSKATSDAPGPGAGNIDTWGARDIYRFEGRAGQDLHVRTEGCTPASKALGWTLVREGGSPDEVASGSIACQGSDENPVTLPADGHYRLVVSTDVTGIIYYLHDLGPDERYDGRYTLTLQDG